MTVQAVVDLVECHPGSWSGSRKTSYLAPIKSRMDTFWYRPTQVHLENGR